MQKRKREKVEGTEGWKEQEEEETRIVFSCAVQFFRNRFQQFVSMMKVKRERETWGKGLAYDREAT